MLSIDFLTQAQMQQAHDLWAYCFGDAPSFIDWFFESRLWPENALGWFDDGRLLAVVHMVPRVMMVRGVPLDTAMILGVATWPHARGKGGVSQLLRRALEVAAERGQELLPLYPFDHAFYRRLGWTTAYERLHIEAPLTALASHKHPAVTLKPAVPDEVHLSAFARVYDARVAQCSGYLLRDERDWHLRAEEMTLDGAHGLLAYRDDEPVGAMIYALSGTTIEVQEWLATTHAAEQAMLGYLGAHASTHENTKLWLAPDAPLRTLLPGAKQGFRLASDTMLRTVNAARLMAALALSGPSATIRLTDAVLPHNNGVFALADGALHPLNETAAAEATLSIEAFTALVSGALSPHQCAWLGMLAGSDDALERLSAWFPKTQACIFEYW